MPHLIRKKWNELKEDDLVKLKGDERIWRLTYKSGGANFVVEIVEWDEGEQKEVVFKEDYDGNWVYSESCDLAAQEFRGQNVQDSTDDGIFRHGWTECEKHYGIQVNGNQLQELALAILRGDPIASDMAKEILKI